MVKEEHRHNLIFCKQPRNVFGDLVTTFAVEYIDFVDLICENGHQFKDKLLRQMSDALLNLLVGNMVRDIISKIHQKVIPSTQNNMITRAKNRDKTRKLSGIKKNVKC